MKKQTTLCMGCMAETGTTDNKICSVCGYTGNSVFLSSYLAPKTFLADRYIIGKLLSYNGEGALYIAYDTKTGTRVTVREFMPDTLCGRKKEEICIEVYPQSVALYKTYLSEFIELNRTLMNSGGNLQIQKVSDVFTENNTAYTVYEYITGVSLKSYLSSLGGVLPWEQVKELFTPLFTTLNLIHAEGIVHRGISPSTIFFNDKNELVLINFGITASRTSDSEINNDLFAGYAAPEQYSSMARHGSHTDVYGMAAVLYKVLTGQMPPSANIRKKDDVLTAPALINRNVPSAVSAAIMEGLAVDEDERTSTLNEFIIVIFAASGINVPDSTSEILIKKPPRKIESAETKTIIKSRTASKKREKKNSNASAIAVCIMLGLVLVSFIVVIVLSARNPDLFGELGNNDNSAEQEADSISSGASATNTRRTGEPASTDENDISESAVLASNEALYVIPNFIERKFEVIQSSNAYSHLIFNTSYEFSYQYEEGAIIEQDIAQGTEVTTGTEIKLKISKGPELVMLPVYTNKKSNDYISELLAAKIKFEVVGEHTDDVPSGIVIRCNVQPGQMVNIGNSETVTVYFSLGSKPETTTVPPPVETLDPIDAPPENDLPEEEPEEDD